MDHLSRARRGRPVRRLLPVLGPAALALLLLARPLVPASAAGTTYWTGDFSTGDMNQFNIHQAGNTLAPKPTHWDQRPPNNGNSSATVQNAVVRPGYAYAVKLQ